jgi:hypothetical protein
MAMGNSHCHLPIGENLIPASPFAVTLCFALPRRFFIFAEKLFQDNAGFACGYTQKKTRAVKMPDRPGPADASGILHRTILSSRA